MRATRRFDLNVSVFVVVRYESQVCCYGDRIQDGATVTTAYRPEGTMAVKLSCRRQLGNCGKRLAYMRIPRSYI